MGSVSYSFRPKGCYSKCYSAGTGYYCASFNTHAIGNGEGTDTGNDQYIYCRPVYLFPTNTAATSNPVASSNCGFDAAQGYQSASNDASCFVRDASNAPAVVDYTAFRYTTYSFTIQMLENGGTPIQNDNISPHGGIKICNLDGTSQARGSSPFLMSPELWFIDRAGDFGYGLYGSWGAFSTAEMRSVSNGLWPGGPRVWKIVMEWVGGSYKLVSWKVDGTVIPSIAGHFSGCGADTSASGQVRVWSYSTNTVKVKDFTVTQSNLPSSEQSNDY